MPIEKSEQSDERFQGSPLDRHPWETDYKNSETTIVPSVLSRRLDINLNHSNGRGGSLLYRTVTFTSGDATPSVLNANICITAGATAITDFDDGKVGQVIYILATGSITVTDNAAIVLNGSANYAMTDTDTLVLCMFQDQIWHELSRSVN